MVTEGTEEENKKLNEEMDKAFEEMADQEMKDRALLSIKTNQMLCEVMNEEAFGAYDGKEPEEMLNILKDLLDRYPEKREVSNPGYLLYGNVNLIGYGTFGVDYFDQLLKRENTDIKLLLRGMIEIFDNVKENEENILRETVHLYESGNMESYIRELKEYLNSLDNKEENKKNS